MSLLAQQLQRLKLRDHICQIYETRQEMLAAIVPFIAQGIARGERCYYIADEAAGRALLLELSSEVAGGESPGSDGQLHVLAEPNASTRTGPIEPDAMIEFFTRTEAEALADGFSGVRIAGDATWVLGRAISADEVLRYEIENNRFLPSSSTMLFCQYSRTDFSGSVIHDVMRTHPLVILGDILCPNPYFEPPDLLQPSSDSLSDEIKQRRVDWWMSRLKEAHKFEQQLVHAEDSLKQVEESDRLRVERYRMVAEALPYIVWMARSDGAVDFLNGRGEEYLGKSHDTIHGERWIEVLHPDDVQSARENWMTAVKNQRFYETEFRFRRHDGEYRWFLSQAFPLPGPGGKVDRWIGTLTDIDKRKQTEESLRLRDRAMQAISQGLLITDPKQPDNPIIYCSPSFERMTGYSMDEVVGRNCRFLQGPATDPDAITALNDAIRQERALTVELLNYRKDGTPFWNELSISPVRDDKGKLTQFIGVQADVTERRKLEEQFRQAQKMETIGQLAGGIAHDFNNLLTIIIGYSDVVIDSVRPDAPIHELLEEIRRAVERSASAIRQILAFSRAQVLSPRVLDVNEIVRETETMIRRAIGEDISLVTALLPTLWSAKADAGQLQQALLNLVMNSRDAMLQGGQLSIRSENLTIPSEPKLESSDAPAGEYVALTVIDTGSGMTEEVKERMFEPFFTTKAVGQGTGLGLAVVNQVVRQNDGYIEVFSEPNLGTSIRILLPRAERPATKTMPRSVAGPARGTETVLVIEDDAAVRSLIRHFLSSSGYTVLEAGTSDEAITLSESYRAPIQLVVMDVVMPGLTGAALAERLQAIHPEIKILFISGYTEDAMLRYGIMQEEMPFLHKPFSPVALAQKVRDVLR